MKVHHEDLYPLTVDNLFEVFIDKAYYETRFSGSGELELLYFGPRGGRFVIDMRRHVVTRPDAKIPPLVKRFVRDVNVIHTVMEWDLSKGESRRGVHRFRVEGVPLEVVGSMHLEPRAAGCANRMVLEVKCTVPLIGGKIAEMAAERAGKTLTKDYNGTMKYLRERGLVQA
jgi:hypothetical protein